MADDTPEQILRKILIETNTIAMVGVSINPVRASFFVARYLHYRGYNVVPVNPVYSGKVMFGKEILPSLADIPKSQPVEMVDIFRRPDAVPGIVDEAIEHLTGLKTIWMQFGIRHEEAAQKARQHGLQVVQDRCPKIEYQRLFGELRKAGINTGIVSSKLPEWK